MIDNSTKFTGVLITKFIEREYPQVKVIHIHSTTNIFRYDENIAFVKRFVIFHYLWIQYPADEFTIDQMVAINKDD